MNCEKCHATGVQFVHCDCFTTLCRACFADHHCGHEHRARFSAAPEPPPATVEDLAAAAFRLRPYQQAAFEAVLEVLR